MKAAEEAHLSDRKTELLVELPAAHIKALKIAAMQRDMTASQLMEQVIREWLRRYEQSPARLHRGEGIDIKKQFLAKMHTKTVRKIKLFAMDRRVPACLVVRRALAEWLDHCRPR